MLGRTAEARAQAWLERAGLVLVVRNYRCRVGEIDLVMLDPFNTRSAAFQIDGVVVARLREIRGLDEDYRAFPIHLFPLPIGE